MTNGQDRLKKLRWRSRRGMKELDVLFESFFLRESDAICKGDWPQLETLLSQEDDLLFDWVSGRNLPADETLIDLICEVKNVS